MTKAEIVEGVYERVGFSKKEATEMVEMIFDLMKEVLERARRSRFRLAALWSRKKSTQGRIADGERSDRPQGADLRPAKP
jgi:nucleoid DNA-binding protein